MPEQLNQFLDFGFRSDIDSAGGLIENKQLRFGRQPSGQQNLLLISATQIPQELLPIRSLDIKRFDEAVR